MCEEAGLVRGTTNTTGIYTPDQGCHVVLLLTVMHRVLRWAAIRARRVGFLLRRPTRGACARREKDTLGGHRAEFKSGFSPCIKLTGQKTKWSKAKS